MWYTKSTKEVLEELRVNPETGLTEAEAERRLQEYGENKLKEKPKKSILTLLLSQLNDYLIYVLLAATLITLIIGEYADAIIIFLVVILNAVIGVIQEYKAEKAIEALKKLTTPKSLVKRNGEVKEISSELIVPGDIVIIDAGRYIPCDLRLIESVNLQIEESALTGESVPVEKHAEKVFDDEKIPIGDRANMAYMSTLATYGRGIAVAVGTGMNTEIGKIAKILEEDEEEMTPLQVRLQELGKILGIVALSICALLFIVALIQKRDPFEMFFIAISLAVAAIPEGLAAIVAIVLALGVQKMSKMNAIVKRLPAVETLGCVNIICSDKTGTLTQNKMTVVRTYTFNHQHEISYESEQEIYNQTEATLIKTMVLCTDATYENGEATGDPTEVALVVLGDKFGLSKSNFLQKHPRVGERPFDSNRKMMSTLNEEENGYRVHTKGALDNLLNICTHVLNDGEVVPLTDDIKKEFLKIAEEMSSEALRVLGCAYKDVSTIITPEEMEKDLILIGFVGMIDPPRLEVKDSIAECKKAGITVIMITGDHKNTAFAIAKELGIATSIDQCLTGVEIDELSDEDFSKNINNYRVFARVSPEHKVKIVRAFKEHGNIVSMTGDGVNDAPSLKFADIGVAMGITGTDVSKGASDMILTDDNFTTIVHAVEEGRNIYNNIKKAVNFLLSCNLGEVFTMFFAILLNWPVPLVATQILWVNLITDALPAIALGIDPGDKDIMKQKPRSPKESFFAHGAWVRVLIGGALIGLLTLFAFYYGLNKHSDEEQALVYARTMAFVVLALSQLFYSLSMRHSHKTIIQVGPFKNMLLMGAILIGMLLQYIIISIPVLAKAFEVQNLPLTDWLLVIGLALVPFVLKEISKVLFTIFKLKHE
ncbi:MAG: calcium-translocating P-type ATPase, SERCA-type [Bacilli bacterium]|nr:calcium-translocating P-type ATPase, SERCA-type [Bacilli bacterium]